MSGQDGPRIVQKTVQRRKIRGNKGRTGCCRGKAFIGGRILHTLPWLHMRLELAEGVPYLRQKVFYIAKEPGGEVMNEPKTCGNCNMGSCPVKHALGKSSTFCQDWQPIPVATTDAKTELQNAIYKYTGQKPDEYPTKQETEDAYVYLAKKGLVVDQKYHGYMLAMHEAIAKKDDLIRGMADLLAKTTEDECMFCGGFDDDHEPLCASRIFISKANELLGVK